MSLKFGISAKFYRKVPTFYGEIPGHIQYLETNIAQWLGDKGALPLMIPSISEKASFTSDQLDPFSYAKELDALILQGGSDVHPSLYGETPRLTNYEFDEERDQYELKLIDAFIRERKPILGICRGFQLLNIYFKGTLHQDLDPSHFSQHFNLQTSRENYHNIQIQKEGVLSHLYKNTQKGSVVSIHHQGIKQLGQDLLVEAVSEHDQLIEAFSFQGDNYILGVQWHPEFHTESPQKHLDAAVLLESLYQAAKDRRFFGTSNPIKKKKVRFGESKELSLGGEIELQIIDQETLDLKPICLQILADTNQTALRTKSEIFQSMIEFESDVRKNAHDIEADWLHELNIVQESALKMNALISAGGTHPFGLISERILTPDSRYINLIEKNQWIARRIAIFGLHVHIGMSSPEEAIRFYRFYMSIAPILLALSASSPFWESEETGLSSVRSTLFESTPTGGHPPCLESWQDFEGLYNKLMTSRSITSHKDLWWDLRPSLNYGTIEIRICDTMPTLKENAAIVALVHLIGLAAQQTEENTFLWPHLSEWSYRENKWRAARHGLDFDLIVSESAETIPAKEFIHNLLDFLEPMSEQLKYQDYMQLIRDILQKGNSSERQMQIFKKSNSMQNVVRHNTEELKNNFPNWSEA